MRTGSTREAGFTYIGLLILLAVLGLVGAAGLKMGSVLQRAAAEDELLVIGAAFSDALASYEAATPKGRLPQPMTLQELLKDSRFPTVRRHLRKIFVDPITGTSDWGLLRVGDKDSGGIIGVYSLSQSKPLKVANFDPRFVGFDNKLKISDWHFTANGQAAVPPPGLVPPPVPGQIVPAPGQLVPGAAAAAAPGDAAAGMPASGAPGTPVTPAVDGSVPAPATPAPDAPSTPPTPAPAAEPAPAPEPAEPPEPAEAAEPPTAPSR